MKKKLKMILTVTGITLAVILTAFILVNLGHGEAVTAPYDLNQIPAATLEKHNGYYKLWSLTEPTNVDVNNDTIIEKYRKTTDPENYLKAFDTKAYLDNYKPYKEIIFKAKLKIPTDYNDDYGAAIMANKENIRQMEKDLKVFLERYNALVDTPVFEDFILFRIDSPIPNLLAWLNASKAFISINMLNAMEGDWENGAKRLLDHLDFGKRATKGSRALITNLIGKAVTRFSIRALNSLMNQKDCPPSVHQMILDRTPPITPDQYGSQIPLKCEASIWPPFMEKDMLDHWLLNAQHSFLLHKNRVQKIHFQHLSRAIGYEMTPPYKWESNMVDAPKYAAGAFWWFRNPMGKIWLDEVNYSNFNNVVLKAYKTKTLYQMLRISAELHLKYDGSQKVKEMLPSLETYKTIDPCSGKPYIWDENRQILYSIGIDRKDDNGVEQKLTREGDFILPVVLFMK